MRMFAKIDRHLDPARGDRESIGKGRVPVSETRVAAAENNHDRSTAPPPQTLHTCHSPCSLAGNTDVPQLTTNLSRSIKSPPTGEPIGTMIITLIPNFCGLLALSLSSNYRFNKVSSSTNKQFVNWCLPFRIGWVQLYAETKAAASLLNL